MHPFGGQRKDYHGKAPRILGVFFDQSASSYYRVMVPMMTMFKLGYPVGWAHSDSIPNDIVKLYDMVVGVRTGSGNPEEIAQAITSVNTEVNKEGRRVRLFLDYDDDLLAIPEHNPAKGVNIEGIKTAMRLSDGLFTTNDRLANVLRGLNTNVSIVPNMVIPELWPKRQKEDDALVIGLVGSDSHIEDWRIVSEPLRRIKETFGDRVQIMTGGYSPDYIPSDVQISWMPLEHYPRLVNTIDIGLCPLVDDHFNRCKSPIKAYEYGLAGAAVVGSPVQYRTVLQGKGLVATTEDEWYDHIALLVENVAKRQEYAQALQNYVRKKINATNLMKEKYAQTYLDAYRATI